MDSPKNDRDLVEEMVAPPDKETLERVKELVAGLAHTISAMKLFPSHHATVLNFQDELFGKLEKFLNEHHELELGIGENTFTFEGETVYVDENIVKSLPYMFFKDGMQMLAFLKDVDKEELLVFLEVIKNVSLLPSETSDIVDALWEKDLAHIRYYAPDEFLESRLAVHQKKIFDFKIDKAKLYQGKIELTQDDRDDISQKLQDLRQKEEKTVMEFAAISASPEKGDQNMMESMLSSHRSLGAERDFLDLIFELLYLEDRLEPFKNILFFLEKHLHDQVRIGDFTKAVQLLSLLEELAQIFSSNFPERALEIEKFLQTIREQPPLDHLRNLAHESQIKNFPSFFEYLRRLGPETLWIGAELLEESHEPEVRSAAFDFFEEVGKNNPGLLVNLAQEQKPFITRAIISVFSELKDKRAIPFLATFLNYKNKDIKLDAIQALGRYSETIAQKILLAYLRDENEDIRLEAARKIELGHDKNLTRQVSQLVSDKNFNAKSLREKEAILNALARSQTDEACAFLQSVLTKSSFLSKAKMDETRLSAARALETMATVQAVDALRMGAKTSSRKIKEACEEALQRLMPNKDTT